MPKIEEKDYAMLEKMLPKDLNLTKMPKTEYGKSVRAIKEYINSIGLRENPGQTCQVWGALDKLRHVKRTRGDKVPFDLLVDLFEIAKLQPKRFLRIKQVGNVIYSYGARLDAINESDYIDSLFTTGYKQQAMRLWESRSDVGDWVYWKEVGASLYIRRYDANNAERVASNMLDQFGYIPPKLVVEFIRLYSAKRDPQAMMRWYDRFIQSASEFEEDEQISLGLDSREAQEIANAKHLPTQTQLSVILEVMLAGHYWGEAERVIKDMHERGVEVPVTRVLELVDNATRRLITGRKAGDRRKPKRRQRRASPPQPPHGKEHGAEFVPMLSTLISIHPQILNSSELYRSWLRGLAGMGLYNNAMQVLDAMVARGIEVDANAFIRALLSKSQVALALNVMKRMDNDLPQADDETFSMFVMHATRRNDHELLQTVLRTSPSINESAQNALLGFYFQTSKPDFLRLVQRIIDQGCMHSTYRTVWLLMRKHVQQQTSPQQMETSLLRPLFSAMVSDSNFRKSAHVYETAVHTFILNHDYVAAAGVLAHMDRTHTKPQGVLALGVVQLASQTKHQTRAIFPKSQDLDTTESGDPIVPWRNIVVQMCRVLEIDPAEVILQAEHLFK